MKPQSDLQVRGNENFGELQTTHATQIAGGKSCLDWGCNDGYGMELMRPYVAQIAGLDSAEISILAAHRRLPDLHSNVRLYDGKRLPFPHCSFDVVTSFQVIEHVNDMETYLSHILEALKSGGKAIFTTPNRNLRLNPGDKPWNHYHVREFAPSQLKELLAPCFSTVEMLGLHATPEMESIERKRCEGSKRAAKRVLPPYWQVRSTMITQLKSVLPDPVLRQMRGLVRLRGKQTAPRN
jgi:SAM-dependent methyltransferase